MAYEESHDVLTGDGAEDLIASDEVEGTTVYDELGRKLGVIGYFLVGKRDGRARYAVLSFGGFLGMGERLFPIPWEMLKYNRDLQGYIVNVDKDFLKDAPSYEPGTRPDFERSYREGVYRHYGMAF